MPALLHLHADAAELVAAMTRILAQTCREAIHARGRAWLALAGGQTPLPVYRNLAEVLEGGSIELVPSDERCVPHAHPACNATALRAAFAGHDALVVHPLTRNDGDADASIALATVLLTSRPAPFDAVLLGMGRDGHFASLFPGAANLDRGLARDSGLDVIATLPVPLPAEAPFARISLTLPRLLHAHAVHLLLRGDEKRRVLDTAQESLQPRSPISVLLHTSTPVPIHVHWSP